MAQAGYRTKVVAVGQEWADKASWVIVSHCADTFGFAFAMGGRAEWKLHRDQVLATDSPWRCVGLNYKGGLFVVGHNLTSVCGRSVACDLALRIVGVVDATTLMVRADGGGEWLCDLAKCSPDGMSLEAVPAVPATDPHRNWCERGVLSINERRADLGMPALPNGQGSMWATVDDLKAAGLLAAEMVNMGVRRMPMRLPDGALTVDDIVNHVASICDIGAKHVHASKKGDSLALFVDEDARKHPAFADARRYAITAAYDGDRLHADAAPDLLAALRLYEDLRGIGAQPKQVALDMFGAWASQGLGGEVQMEAARVAYERARVPWRPTTKAPAPPVARPKRAQCISNVGADRAERFGSL